MLDRDYLNCEEYLTIDPCSHVVHGSDTLFLEVVISNTNLSVLRQIDHCSWSVILDRDYLNCLVYLIVDPCSHVVHGSDT